MNKLFFRILTISGLLLIVPAKAMAAEGTVTFEMLKPETALRAAQAALEALPGVGHKTASVVMAQAFGHPATAQGQPAVDHQVRAVEERRKVGRHVDVEPRHLLRVRDAADRVRASDLVEEMRDVTPLCTTAQSV